jgi:putative hydrolase of the HAD superfamily
LPTDIRWIGFDLDDTLHYFKRASGRAAKAVFAEIERELKVRTEDLEPAYSKVLETAQRGRFSQAKTSREYRAERFEALLRAFERDPGPHLEQLLDTYDAALGEALELKPGAREVLAAAKRTDLSVLVISEGPHDAQETTIERLGIASSVDLLVTSSGEGRSKSNGLFAKALARAGCQGHELLYVGDSLDRDIVPTSALGIANAYVGDGDPAAGSTAMQLDLFTLAHLLDQLAEG